MKNEKRKIYVSTIIFFIIVLSIITIPELIENKDESIDKKIIFVVKTALWILPFSISPLLVYLAREKGKKKAIQENLSDADFKNRKEYYREILKKHSPAELSYIDNFEIDLNKEIIATILSLQLKNKIIIKDNYIEVIDNNNINLTETENYILSSIKNGKVIIYNPYELEGSARKEALINGLIIKNEPSKEKIKPLFGSINSFMPELLIFWGIIFIMCIFNGPVVDFLNNVVIPNIDVITPIILLLIILFVISKLIKIYKIVFKSYYSHYKSNSYKRTKLGEELNKKIEGLKNYINSFSSLSEKEKEELILWDEYLIYSVIFNSNKKIVKELSSLIEFVE